MVIIYPDDKIELFHVEDQSIMNISTAAAATLRNGKTAYRFIHGETLAAGNFSGGRNAVVSPTTKTGSNRGIQNARTKYRFGQRGPTVPTKAWDALAFPWGKGGPR